MTSSPYPMIGKTFLHWQDAWRDMGRDEASIAAEEKARAQRYEAYERPWRRCHQKRSKDVRSRLWGKSAANDVLRRARLAPLVGYFLKSLKNEWVRPSWDEKMTLRRLWKYALASLVGGVMVSPFPQRSTSRYFGEALKWARNAVFGAVKRGEISRGQGDAMRACLGASADEPLAGKMARFKDLFTKGIEASKLTKEPRFECATDTRAGEDLYRDIKEKLPYTAAHQIHEEFALKGQKNTHKRQPDGAPILRFKGVLPRKLWSVVWSWRTYFENLHWPDCKVLWSLRHWLSWFKSCLVAGKSACALNNLYYDTMIKWHGRAVDWLPTYESRLEPYGMFAELYRTAAELPQSRYFNPSLCRA